MSREAKILAEEGENVALEAIRNRAGVGSRIELKAIRDPAPVEDVVQLTRIHAEAVLVAGVNRDRLVLLQVIDGLFDKHKWRVAEDLATSSGRRVSYFVGDRRPAKKAC